MKYLKNYSKLKLNMVKNKEKVLVVLTYIVIRVLMEITENYTLNVKTFIIIK